MKIYTKAGDQGKTVLYGNSEKLSKCHAIFDILGSIDELSGHIAKISVQMVFFKAPLETIQQDLMDISANLASQSEQKQSETCLNDDMIQFLETRIDDMDKLLPKLTSFVLPTGHPTVPDIHIARAVCRRAERCICKVEAYHGGIPQRYLNRLSDYLFTFARYVNHFFNVNDTKYKPCSRKA